VKPSPNPSPKNEDDIDYEPIVKKLNEKLKIVDKELNDSEEVKIKL